jgi:hypothetical protein
VAGLDLSSLTLSITTIGKSLIPGALGLPAASRFYYCRSKLSLKVQFNFGSTDTHLYDLQRVKLKHTGSSVRFPDTSMHRPLRRPSLNRLPRLAELEFGCGSFDGLGSAVCACPSYTKHAHCRCFGRVFPWVSGASVTTLDFIAPLVPQVRPIRSA